MKCDKQPEIPFSDQNKQDSFTKVIDLWYCTVKSESKFVSDQRKIWHELYVYVCIFRTKWRTSSENENIQKERSAAYIVFQKVTADRF